ncbi:MAG: signal peptidase I [SAR202 cluster bacterium]|nr:signal peptidase I [SAR202 cluster bacterium]
MVRGFLFESLETVLLALAVFLILQASVQNFRVEGISMDPTLTHGQYLLVNKLVYEPIPFQSEETVNGQVTPNIRRWIFPFHPPEQGDVIVFHEPTDPTRDFVKRIIGVPGNTVEMKFGVVYVNGNLLEEPYLGKRDTSNLAPVFVQPGFYFVLGDNRSASYDSRGLGPIPQENIVGKAWFSYWPLPSIETLSAVLGFLR